MTAALAAVRMAAGLALVALLGGCAGGTQGGATGADLPTASDQTDAQRRARIRLELASGYFDEGKTTVALDELKQVLQLDPNLPEAHNLRGLIYMRLDDKRLAEDAFRRAYQLAPRDPNVAHNYGWLLCQQGRVGEAEPYFAQALGSAVYGGKAKTWMAQGVCQLRAGQRADAERSLTRAYELDPGNPVAAYNLARLLYEQGDAQRAQFYARRLNNSELANAETLWLGVKIERRLGNTDAQQQLADQLRKRFVQSRETLALDRGAFNE